MPREKSGSSALSSHRLLHQRRFAMLSRKLMGALAAAFCLLPATAQASDCGCDSAAYASGGCPDACCYPKVRYKTCYQTVVEECPRTVWQDCPKTVMKECRYQVCKPVTETIMKECRYQVCKPVYEEREFVKRWIECKPV